MHIQNLGKMCTHVLTLLENNMKNFDWFKFWGIFFFVLVIANLVIHILFEERDMAEVFWFCNVMSFYLAFGFFLKRKELINAVLAMSIPAQFFWILDYILQLFGTGYGRTNWMFESSALFITPIISVIMHGLTIPLAFWGSYKMGFTKRAYPWMLAIVFILLPATFFFTSSVENRNCVFYPCDMDYVDALANSSYVSVTYLIKTLSMLFVVCTSMFLFLWSVFSGHFSKLLRRVENKLLR